MNAPRLLPLGVSLLIGVSNLAAQAPDRGEARTTNPAASQYQLFVGLDLEVPWKDEFRPIRRALNRNLGVEIHADGALHRVLLERVGNVRMRHELKLSRAPISIVGLNTERCYSPWADPARKWMRAEITMSSQSDVQIQETTADMLRLDQQVLLEPSLGGPSLAELEAARAQREARYEQSLIVTTATNLGDRGWSNRLNTDLDQELFDAIEATFQVSAAETIADAYIVMLVDYRLPNQTKSYRFIYTQEIGTVDQNPRQVRLWSAGLPPGYELVETRIHLYVYGAEYASNLSDKAVTVSEEQAYTVLMAHHLGTHRDRTVDAVPIWETAPANFRARLDPRDLPPIAELHIDPEGRVQQVLDGNGEPLRVVGLTRDVLTRTRFLPALENGTPVASVLRVNLPDFLR